MNPTARKWIVRPLLLIIIVIGALAGTGFLVLSTQQERLVNLAIGELNKQLKGELSVEESRISLFRNFPYISIALHSGRFFAYKEKKGIQGHDETRPDDHGRHHQHESSGRHGGDPWKVQWKQS